MTPCERFILHSLRRSPCRIEAFDGREFNKQTVNESLTALMRQDKVIADGFIYKINPSPAPHQWSKPNLKVREVDPRQIRDYERRKRIEQYAGPLEDNSSTERGGGKDGWRTQ